MLTFTNVRERNALTKAKICAANIEKARKDMEQAERDLVYAIAASGQRQSDIAGALGITPQYLSDIMKGRRGVSDEFINAVKKIKL